ncbi:uncharacterized protein PV09_09036 [Verruconis gallopava]|uniref:Zinc knuckle-domain-containing protein n=1 Tax=Verruconis gallopava TaxID=253628 RepID=A0A0D1YEV8_9PEZI|nr:uncharacterized protein PV09_09036 [Verruconis gallopava]KIV99266.1 hypothetical protein PV09_09036 [Verruconis gallopava]
MNRGAYRPPPTSRASASTLCQKCLKRGHYSYECKAAPQERPYIARPSRTQQLLNPKLAPKLTNEAPDDLMQKKGVADAQLAKSAAERGRKRSMSIEGDRPRKRSRSASSCSSSSVSTISTSRSRSASRNRRPSSAERMVASQHDGDDRAESSFERKRRRRPSAASHEGHGYRNTRRRRSERSPGERGRRTSRMEDDMERRSRTGTRSGSRQNGRKASRSRNRTRQSGRTYSRSPSPYRRQPRDTAPRERSLSPYSKRMAMTRALNSDV